jgi:hypothetical protein
MCKETALTRFVIQGPFPSIFLRKCLRIKNINNSSWDLKKYIVSILRPFYLPGTIGGDG